jgi:outer membrane receptor for ferrienterochelin and colicins
LNLAYTYTEAKDLSNRNRLTRSPKHIARLGIDWVLPSQTELSLRHRYQSSEVVDSKTQSTSPAWQRVDFIVNQPLGKGFKALFGINNIFNKQRNFQDTEDFSPITGRFIYLGVRYQWQK